MNRTRPTNPRDANGRTLPTFKPRLGIQTKLMIGTGLLSILVAGIVGVYGVRMARPAFRDEFRRELAWVTAPMRDWERDSIAILDADGPAESVDEVGEEEGIGRSLLVSLLAALSLSLAFGIVLARHLTGPIRVLSRCTEQVTRGDWQAFARVQRRDELGDLAAGFNQMIEHLRENQEALLGEANVDTLTGLPNHRRAQELLARELRRALDREHVLGVIIVDIDNFKLFNDSYGHLSGDQVVKSVARILVGAVRSSDIVGRFGGDEFIIIVPETDAAGVASVARRFLAELRGSSYLGSSGTRVPVTCSIGSALCPFDSTVQSELVNLADMGVREVKREGGNGYRATGLMSDRAMGAPSPSFGVLEGLVEAVDGKDHYTRQHSEMVTRLSLAAADRLYLPDEVRNTVRIASLLHDVGKIGIPNGILRKPAPLTEREYEIMKEHPRLGAMIIQELPHLTQVLSAIKHHHERFDGRGYPDGLKEWDIPLVSRILAVADAYSAMTSDRPYRKALGHGPAVEELKREAGLQFDPDIVDLFLGILKSDDGPLVVASA